MHSLDGKDFLANTENTSCLWLENYISTEDYPLVLTAIRESIENKNAFELEHRLIRADTNIGWTFSRAVPLLDETAKLSNGLAQRPTSARARK